MRTSILLTITLIFLIPAFGQQWWQSEKIVASDREIGDQFGESVSISGNYAIAGAPQKDDSTVAIGYGTGAAYIFERNETWTQKAKLVASDRTLQDGFGYSVAIDGNTAIVGAPFESDSVFIWAAGAAYIFERDAGGNWNEITKILATDRSAHARFGYSVAISGDYAIIGAIGDCYDAEGQNYMGGAGATYIFERDHPGGWGLKQKLVAPDRYLGDLFGNSVAINERYAVVGVELDDDGPPPGGSMLDAGSVHIFERDTSGVWQHLQKVIANDGYWYSYFGNAISIHEDFILVGAERHPHDSTGGNYLHEAGAAYLLRRMNNGMWVQWQKIVSPEREANKYFGLSVSLSDSYALIADDKPWGVPGAAAGAVFVFRKGPDNQWNEMDKLVAGDRSWGDSFGWSVGISEDLIFVGAPFEDHDAVGGDTLHDAGSAYIFRYGYATDISQHDYTPKLKVYPNPTSGEISMGFEKRHAVIDLYVSNVVGQEILGQRFRNEDEVRFEIEGPRGLYFLRIRITGGSSFIVKVLKL